MSADSLFPASSTRDTLAFCWRQVGPYKRGMVAGWCLTITATVVQSVAGPLIFAMLLTRVAELPPHASFATTFEPLVIAYGLTLLASTLLWRWAGWIEWGASLGAFAHALVRGYTHLIRLSHRWHSDRPAGEVISTLETFSWAFVDLLDTVNWGFLRIGVTVLSAIIVLAIYAWPVALVMAGLLAVFCLVLQRRMALVVAAGKRFSDTHSHATGVLADTIANLTTIRTQSAELLESRHVEALVGETVKADLEARRIFATTRLQMEGSLGLFSWLAVLVGVVLALRHSAAAGTIYLILFYATSVVASMEESFEHIRTSSRGLGRCAKFAGIAATSPEVVDAPGSSSLVVHEGRVEMAHIQFSYPGRPPLFDDLTLAIQPGEHIGLVGSSGSGKTTLTKLALRFMDLSGGTIAIDGQDIAKVTQASLRRHISFVPQDPQMLHRTIAENICYGIGETGEPDMEAVNEVGRAAHVEEFVRRLPDGYHTVV
ncbi:MAG: ABC transporter ATP-binding protein, partial [Acidimicrobiales bacterium]